LKDGLQICTGNRIVDTSFIHLLFKLIRFDIIKYQCKASSGEQFFLFNRITADQNCLDIRNYFANENDNRPACTCLGTHDKIDCDEVEEGLMSSNNVTLNERSYKDVLVLKNGARLSLTDDSPECFEGINNVIMLQINVR